MLLDDLQISKKNDGNFFYFAADSRYFDLYGKALALSLKNHAPWSNVHVHLYNARDDQKEWCKFKDISFSEEKIDLNHKEFSTLCACIRFIRIPEIFEPSAKVVSFDCDVIANNTISFKVFQEATDVSRITIRKGGKSLASAISFGKDNFRNIYRTRLLTEFSKDNIYWFLDQDILDSIMLESPLPQLSGIWTSTKMTPDRMIFTAKGDRKSNSEQYLKLLNYYNSLE
jgi:hypothetical protein